MENHHLHNFHFLRTLKSQPVKKTDGGEFRHPDIPCFQVIRAFDIKVYHFISAFEIASFWHNILGWNWRSGNELQFFFTNLVWQSKENIDKRILEKIQQWYAWYCWAVDHILLVSQVRDDDMKSGGQLIRLNSFSPAQIAQLTTCNLTNTKSLKLDKFQRSLLDVVQLFGHLAVGLNNSLTACGYWKNNHNQVLYIHCRRQSFPDFIVQGRIVCMFW